MLLPSRLGDTTLGDLLAALQRCYACGVLRVEEASRSHAVHLRRGLVQAIESSDEALRFGGVAASRRLCDPALVEATATSPRGAGPRIGQRLVGAGLLTSRARDEVLVEQRSARLEALYAVPDAELRFEPLGPLPPGSAELTPMSARQVLFGRRRRRDAGVSRREEALATLGLRGDATAAEVRARYRERVAALHPDHCDGLATAEREVMLRELRAVIESYRALA